MTPADLMLAALLITTPPDIPEKPPPYSQWPGMQASLRHVCQELEILDVREKNYILASHVEFPSDIKLLRARYQFFKDIPRIGDADRLPSRSDIQSLINFNRRFKRHLETMRELELDRAELYSLIISDNEAIYNVYDFARDARCEFYYVTVRREALRRLRDTLGEVAYNKMDLPPNVPIWWFAQYE